MVAFVASQTILTSCIIVVAFVFQCESNAEGGSHSFRHQHGQPKKYDESERGNDTDSAKSLKIPDLIVKPKEEIYLNCFLPQTTLEKIGYAVRWLHNGLIVDTVDIGSTSNGYRYSRDPTSGQLYISSVRMEDDGLWHCQYQDHKQEHSIASRPLKLVVLDKPRVPYFLIDGRRLDPGNLFIPVKESLELKMTCVVEGGNPRPRIKWMLILSENLDPTLIGEDTVSVALNVTDNYRSDMLNNRVNSHEQTRSEARLVRIQRVHHNATVVCIVQHVTLKTTLNASLLLDVQYTPSFAISREPGFGFPLREGMSVSLKCEVDSNPPSLPIWVKDDGSPLSSSSIDGFLNFTSIKKEHSGWYKCICHHLLGEFSSIGYFLNVRNDYTLNRTLDPALESYPTGRQVEVPLGGTIQIQCPEEAMGCWSRVGVNGRLEPVGPGPSLVMSNILYQDAGEYRCVSSRRAELDRWRSEVNVDVTVKGRPVVYPPETTVTAYTGQELEFSVEFCANPPVSKAFWVTETQLLVPGRVHDDYVPHNFTVGSSIHCQEAVLTLRRVRMRDVGEIMFVARSSVGVAQGTIVLNVTPAAGYSSSSRPVPGLCIFVFFLCRGLLVPSPGDGAGFGFFPRRG